MIQITIIIHKKVKTSRIELLTNPGLYAYKNDGTFLRF